MAPEFKPGAFEPIIQVSPRGDGLTRAFHGDKEGLFQVCKDTYAIAYASSLGSGGNIDYNRGTMSQLAKITAQFLWVRNLSNQLAHLGVNNRFAKGLLQDFPLPEPIIKLFNVYGHVEHEEVKYTQLDLEREFCWSMLDLLTMTNDVDWDDDNDLGVADPPEHDELDTFMLSSTGEIEITRTVSVSEYLSTILHHISGQAGLTSEQKLRYSKNIIDVATERDLRAALLWLRNQPGVGQLPARPARDPAGLRDRLVPLFGDHVQTDPGRSLPTKDIAKAISRISEGIRRAVDEIFVSVTLGTIPKYEKGSLAQLSETIDDTTTMHFPMSFADLTVAAAFRVGRVLRRFLRASPEQTDDALRADLIRKSVRRRA
ncbi:capsid protein [Aspergillus niger partitivirus 1]|nr:capsid protein [Aspergillus niger partitivirus 1]